MFHEQPLLVFTICSACCFFLLPWGLVWRCFSVFALLLAARWRLTPPVHWSDRDWGYDLAMAAWTIVVTIIVVFFSIRFFIEQHRHRRENRKPPTGTLLFCDILLASAVACLASLYVFIAASWILQSSGYAMLSHVALVITAFLAATRVLKNGSTIFRFPVISFAVASLFLAGWSFLAHPYSVLAAAKHETGDAPFCIALQNRRRPVASPLDLTFLTMDKNHNTPHAVLVFKDGDEIHLRHWSYHRRSFDNISRHDTFTCTHQEAPPDPNRGS